MPVSGGWAASALVLWFVSHWHATWEIGFVFYAEFDLGCGFRTDQSVRSSHNSFTREKKPSDSGLVVVWPLAGFSSANSISSSS